MVHHVGFFAFDGTGRPQSPERRPMPSVESQLLSGHEKVDVGDQIKVQLTSLNMRSDLSMLFAQANEIPALLGAAVGKETKGPYPDPKESSKCT